MGKAEREAVVATGEQNDRSLVLRTLAAMALAAGLGWLLASGLSALIRSTSAGTAKLREHIVSVEVWQRIQRVVDSAAVDGMSRLWIAAVGAILLGLALPLLFYSPNSRSADRSSSRWARFLAFGQQLLLLVGFGLGLRALFEALYGGNRGWEGTTIAALCVGAAFVLIGDAAFAGQPSRWRHWRTLGWHNALRCFGFGAVWGGASYALQARLLDGQRGLDEYLERLFHFLLTWSGGPESPTFEAAVGAFERSSILLLALGGAFALGTFVACSPTAAPCAHRIVALVLAATPLVAGYMYHRAALTWEPPVGLTIPWPPMNCQTFECGVGIYREDRHLLEPGMSKSRNTREPLPPWQVAAPGPDGPMVITWPLTIKLQTMGNEITTEASAVAIEQTQRFLNKNKWTRWTVLASQYPIDGYLRQWRPKRALEAMVADVARTGNTMSSIRATRLATLLPNGPEMRAVATRLLDPKRFRYGKKRVEQLAWLAARVGNKALTRRLRREAGLPVLADTLPGWQGGELSACLTRSVGRPAIGLMVGLFRVLRPLRVDASGISGERSSPALSAMPRAASASRVSSWASMFWEWC